MELLVTRIQDDGSLDQPHYQSLLAKQPKLVAITWVSNALGTINPMETLVAQAKAAGATTLVDACQRAPHGAMDVQALDCDFLVFSGHKVYGPTGIGVLYGKAECLAATPPWQGGGEMIAEVRLPTGTQFAAPPHRFEAGTPHIAGAAGLGAALAWLMELDAHTIHAHEQTLLAHLTDSLQSVDGLHLLGTAQNKVPICSFTLDGIPPYDIAQPLGKYGGRCT